MIYNDVVIICLYIDLSNITIKTINNIPPNSMDISIFYRVKVIPFVKNSGLNSGKLIMTLKSNKNQHISKYFKRTLLQ